MPACPHCPRTFELQPQLAAHIRFCKDKAAKATAAGTHAPAQPATQPAAPGFVTPLAEAPPIPPPPAASETPWAYLPRMPLPDEARMGEARYVGQEAPAPGPAQPAAHAGAPAAAAPHAAGATPPAGGPVPPPAPGQPGPDGQPAQPEGPKLDTPAFLVSAINDTFRHSAPVSDEQMALLRTHLTWQPPQWANLPMILMSILLPRFLEHPVMGPKVWGTLVSLRRWLFFKFGIGDDPAGDEAETPAATAPPAAAPAAAPAPAPAVRAAARPATAQPAEADDDAAWDNLAGGRRAA